MNYDKTKLVKWLSRKNTVYSAAITELRKAASEWLEYSRTLFPHYTSHTVSHSDEMVVQLSMVLFPAKSKSKPVLDLNATEAFILLSGVYLHDAGMVVSPKDAADILDSDGWKVWTTGDGGGAKILASIQAARTGSAPPSKTQRDFLADVQLRYLLAEFVRRTHAERASQLVSAPEGVWKPYLLHDRTVVNAVARLCAAHGLKHQELDDNDRFPDDCQIQGEHVNLRLLAILLRLADLLDFRETRSCPWLMNAASPIPADSLPHWKACERINMLSVSPEKVLVKAECLTQEEHRVLLDWCQWLCQETRNARQLVARMSRHSDWHPPIAETDGPNATIRIVPAQGASYVFKEWRLEMDQEEIMRRLTHDLYGQPLAFVRELIQNALDATRTQMFLDMQKAKLKLPEDPSRAPASIRAKYPVRVTLETCETTNEESDAKLPTQFLSVEDCGIGMDEDVILKYFLQVGRSFYTTDEYRRMCSFAPTSRFGVGFLSVFGVSNHVTVETLKSTGTTPGTPIKLTLTGPRNYLLVEKSARESNGTTVKVRLDRPLKPGELTDWVKNNCLRVEYPLPVDDLGAKTTVRAERSSDFTYETPVAGRPGATLAVVSHPVRLRGYRGEVYALTYRDKRGEDWTQGDWALEDYPRSHPGALEPRVRSSMTCYHGIMVPGHRDSYGGESFWHRLDYRGPLPLAAVSREDSPPDLSKGLEHVWSLLLKRHLSTTRRAKGKDAWMYKQELLVQYLAPLRSLVLDFVENCPRTIMAYRSGRRVLVSLSDIRAAEPLVTCEGHADLRRMGARRWPGLLVTPSGLDGQVVQDECYRRALRELMLLDGVRVGFWTRSMPAHETSLEGDEYSRYYSVDLPEGVAAIRIGAGFYTLMWAIALARNHAFGEWISRLQAAETVGKWPGAEEYLPKLHDNIQRALNSYEKHGLRDLNRFLSASDSSSSLPRGLRPGGITLTPDALPDCYENTHAHYRRHTRPQPSPGRKSRDRRH
jgi:hypothetical protein